MKTLGKKLFLASFILAIIASGFVYIYLRSLDNTEVKVNKVKILVAAQNIPPRTLIEKKMVKEIEISEDSEFGQFISDKNEIVGKYSKETILVDERFHKDKLLGELEKELSMKISGNNRAVSLFVNGEAGVADLIRPGDFVDVIVYLPELKENDRIVRPDLTKIILQNIQVLSIDKTQYRDEDERVEIPNAFLTTLSVPVFEVEKLVLAEDIGNIKLALRPLDGDYIHQTDGFIWQEFMLDDFSKMKDMFQQYEVKKDEGTVVNEEEYNYEKYYYYTIQYGDTLSKISQKFYGDTDKYELIQQVNRIEDEDKIIAGTGIKIPVLEETGVE